MDKNRRSVVIIKHAIIDGYLLCYTSAQRTEMLDGDCFMVKASS